MSEIPQSLMDVSVGFWISSSAFGGTENGWILCVVHVDEALLIKWLINVKMTSLLYHQLTQAFSHYRNSK